MTLLVYATGAAAFPYPFFSPEVQQRLLQQAQVCLAQGRELRSLIPDLKYALLMAQGRESRQSVYLVK